MFDYGNGSHGALNVTSGTHNLALNTRHQFTTVNVSSGATLSTSSTTGSVLHISATESITINGTVNVSNKVNHGNNTWSATIAGVTYTSPGVANGGRGGNNTGSTGGSQGSGFGGGGAGGGLTYQSGMGGNGGAGAATFGSGGSAVSAPSNQYRLGLAGSGSGGGSGSASNYSNSGTVTSGAGGNSYGANGGNASSGVPDYEASGGGGAGGRAGRSGVHVVISAPTVIVNGSVITSGTSGQKGGNGGNPVNSYDPVAVSGSGAGGGGGGRAGNITLIGANVSRPGTFTMSAGSGGARGTGRENGVAGSSGSSGTMSVQVKDTAGSSTVYVDSSHNLILTEDYNLSSNSSVVGISSTTPTPVEGGPKVSVIAYGFGGGMGSATAFGVASPGAIQEPILSDETLEPRNSLTSTDSTSPIFSHQYRLLANGSIVNTSSNGMVLSQEHEMQVSESTSTTDSDSPWLIYSTLLNQPSPSIVYTSSDTFWIAQDNVMKPDNLLIKTYSKNIDMVNWDKLGVRFGRYREAYSNVGELRDLVNYIFESEDEIFIFEDEQGYGVLVPERQKETLSHIKTYKLGGALGVIINALFESEDSMFYFESEDEKSLLGPEESNIPQAFTKNYKQKGRF